MGYSKDKSLKMIYTTHEVAEIFNVNDSTIRYWETQFPQIAPKVGDFGVRQYTQSDIDKVRVVYNLVKVRGFKIAAAKKMLNANIDEVNKTTDVINALMEVRDELMEIKKQLSMI